MTSKVYTFKRRGNRRIVCVGDRPPIGLTDRRGERYVPTKDLASIIRLPAQFIVRDAKSQRDITEATLLRVVVDLEQGTPLMSEEFLRELIRLRAQGPQPLLHRFLEESMRFLIEETKA